MGHGLCRRDGTHLVAGKAAKWPAACRQCNFADLIDPTPGEALENRVVFGIHWQQSRARPCDGGHHEFASRN